MILRGIKSNNNKFYKGISLTNRQVDATLKPFAGVTDYLRLPFVISIRASIHTITVIALPARIF